MTPQVGAKMSAQSSQGKFRSSNTAASAFGQQMAQYVNRRNTDVVQINAQQTAAPTSSGVSADTEAKLAELREIGANADYTGMSYSEIYKAIWDRYNEASDGKLGMNAFYSPPLNKDIPAINNQLSKELQLHIYTPLEKELEEELGFTKQENRAAFQEHFIERRNAIHAEAMGYGGMNYEETEQAIVEKYKGKTSLQDFLEMQGELYETGVLWHKLGGFDRLGEYYTKLDMQINLTYFHDSYVHETPMEPEQYNAALSKGFDPTSFFSDLKQTIDRSTYMYYNRGYDVKDQLLQDVDSIWALYQTSTQ